MMTDIEPALRALTDFFLAPSADSKRLFHGRGGCYPGLEGCVIDVFSPTVLVTFFDEPESGLLAKISAHIQARLPCEYFDRLAVQHRYLTSAPIQWLIGEPLVDSFAQRGKTRFHLRYTRQNVGFFLDMENGRRWLEARAQGCNVLNLFSYTCAFSVIAQVAGALKVVNVDMSRAALTTGRDNHHLNQLPTDSIQFMPLDILKSWSRIRKPGPYDIVIIDPPSFQKGSFIASRDYKKVVRRLRDLVRPGGDVLACLNAPELGAQFLVDVFAEFAPECRFVERVSPPKVFCDVNAERQLKLLHFQRSN